MSQRREDIKYTRFKIPTLVLSSRLKRPKISQQKVFLLPSPRSKTTHPTPPPAITPTHTTMIGQPRGDEAFFGNLILHVSFRAVHRKDFASNAMHECLHQHAAGLLLQVIPSEETGEKGL